MHLKHPLEAIAWALQHPEATGVLQETALNLGLRLLQKGLAQIKLNRVNLYLQLPAVSVHLIDLEEIRIRFNLCDPIFTVSVPFFKAMAAKRRPSIRLYLIKSTYQPVRASTLSAMKHLQCGRMF